MSEIWNIVAELGIEFHPERIDAIARRISVLGSLEDFAKIRPSFGPDVDHELSDKLEEAWKRYPRISPAELASALQGASRTASLISKRESIDLVWTGPHTGVVSPRHTEQVLLEVIALAKHKLFIVSYVAVGFDTVLAALERAASRNVKTDILLEPSKAHGGRVDVDSVKAFSDSLPLADIYVWKSELESAERFPGAVHAKCAVADGKMAFITSANLTKAALEKNMELGVLIKGGDIPEKLDRHLDSLISTRVIGKI